MEENSARNQRKLANTLKKCVTLLKKGKVAEALNLAKKVVKKTQTLPLLTLLEGEHIWKGIGLMMRLSH